MATRTVKVIGRAYSTSGSVTLVINWNGSEVYNGTVPTVNGAIPEFPDAADMQEVCTFETTTDVTGAIPLTISSSGGSLAFADLFGNYTGYDGTVDAVTTQPVDFYSTMNFNTTESDGKNNVSMSPDDGQSRTIVDGDSTLGDWIYKIYDGSTLSCDYTVDPNTTVLKPGPR